MFVAEKDGLYQIRNEQSTCEEIMESNEEISHILKNLNFKRLNLKRKCSHIGIIHTQLQKQIKVNDIKTSDHLVALHAEKIIFNLNSDKLRILALLKLHL
jgi:hypothetical protein